MSSFASELAHADHRQRLPLGRDEPVGRGEHVGGQRGDRGDGGLEGVEAEEVTGGDPQLLAGLPAHEPVDGVAVDGQTFVERGEHRQRLAIRLDHTGQRPADSGHGHGRGDEVGVVGEHLGRVRSRTDEAFEDASAVGGRRRALDRLVQVAHPPSVADVPNGRQLGCQRVTLPGNPLSVQAYTTAGRSIQNGRNGGGSSSPP